MRARPADHADPHAVRAPLNKGTATGSLADPTHWSKQRDSVPLPRTDEAGALIWEGRVIDRLASAGGVTI